MYLLKLALPLAGLLLAGQALAHKASGVHGNIPSALRQAPAQADTAAIALLDGTADLAVRDAFPEARSATYQPSFTSHRSKQHINHRH